MRIAVMRLAWLAGGTKASSTNSMVTKAMPESCVGCRCVEALKNNWAKASKLAVNMAGPCGSRRLLDGQSFTVLG
eukprot:1156138-Pelagomonas_calceolata.AAC.18